MSELVSNYFTAVFILFLLQAEKGWGRVLGGEPSREMPMKGS